MIEDKKQLIAEMESQLAELDQKIAELEASSQPVEPDKAIGRLTRLDEMNARSVKLAALNTAKEKQQNLRKMLTQVHSPNFGKCALCKKSIPFERIMAVPESPFCTACAGF